MPIDTESGTPMTVSDTLTSQVITTCGVLAALVVVLSLVVLSVARWLWIRHRRNAPLTTEDSAFLLREALRLAESIPRLTGKQ